MKDSNRRLAALLVAMVAVPVAAVSWVGSRLVADQAALARHEVGLVFVDRLAALDRAIGSIVRGLERELGRYEDGIPDDPRFDVDRVRDAIRKFPREVDALVLDVDGKVLYPPLNAPTSQDERDFLQRTRGLWEGGLLASVALRGRSGVTSGPDRGWVSFFVGGAQHFLWWHFDGRRVVALEAPNVLFLSELVMQLPDTPVEPVVNEQALLEYSDAAKTPDVSMQEGRTVLLDAMSNVVYQWGAYTPRLGEAPKATMSLSEPLSAWTLKHYAPESDLPGKIVATLRGWLVGGLGALAAALGLGAWLIWRVRVREMKTASERVSFVNQVSHELKTPLTNIRMYTELLKDRLDAEDLLGPGEPMARHMDVLERETERLSRMIKNVLSFARGHEDKLTLQKKTAVPDDIVRATLQSFAPSLAQNELVAETALDAREPVALDVDFFEQVLANLLSNVEKYARSGKYVRVSTRRDGVRLLLVVEDRGPGVPPEFQEKVFEPFWRMSNKATDSAAGTGIGLDIARRLTRLHGGDLRLLPSSAGARFEATFEVGSTV